MPWKLNYMKNFTFTLHCKSSGWHHFSSQERWLHFYFFVDNLTKIRLKYTSVSGSFFAYFSLPSVCLLRFRYPRVAVSSQPVFKSLKSYKEATTPKTYATYIPHDVGLMTEALIGQFLKWICLTQLNVTGSLYLPQRENPQYADGDVLQLFSN